MDAYKAWVRRNRLWISSFENLVNTMTWFLPERLSNSELTPETVSTVLGLVTVMNQHIIETDPRPQSRGVNQQRMPEPTPEHNESVPWPLFISVMKEVEVLTEMAAEHYLGRDKKWGPVVSIEAIKTIIRLIILHKSGYKMLLDGGESKNDGETALREPERQFSQGQRTLSMSQQQQIQRASRERQFGGQNPRDLEGVATQAMHRFNVQVAGPNRPSWIRQQQIIQESRVQETLTYNSSPVSLAPKAEGYVNTAFVTGEVLLIARPLFYALLVWRYGLKSWRPWLAALSIDLTGMFLVSRATSSHIPGGQTGDAMHGVPTQLSIQESLELRRRKLRWALYVMRDPFFNRFTRRPVEAAEKVLSPVPVLGTLAGKAVDLLFGVQQLYTYTAAS